MTNYIDTIDYYDTPLVDQRAGMIEYGAEDPVRQIQIRMVMIFALALIIASALTLLALPGNVGIGSGTVAVEANVTSNTEIQNNMVAIVEQETVTSGTGISALFTPEVQYWEDDIIRWAEQFDVDPNAVATIMQIESCGNPQAVSIAGARGLFQVMPFHFSAGEDMLDPDTNARRGMDFLNEQLRYTGGDLFLSFAGYNGGYAASGGSYGNWPDETKRYHLWAKGIYEDASSGAVSSDTLNTWLDSGGRPGCEIAAGQLGL